MIKKCVFLKITLNSDQHLDPRIFYFYFQKKKAILDTPLGFNNKS
jgi:hypothetical protein